MPIEPCYYCEKVDICGLWSQACAVCHARYVTPLLKRGVPFKSLGNGSIRSYPPENWRELLEGKGESESHV